MGWVGLGWYTCHLWAEFGRTPTAQGKNGRDHNPHAFTYWMAGRGVKKGFSYGETDEYGFYARENKVHAHDFHATLLHLLGIDHEKLTYRYGGRDFRLTDVHARLEPSIESYFTSYFNLCGIDPNGVELGQAS